MTFFYFRIFEFSYFRHLPPPSATFRHLPIVHFRTDYSLLEHTVEGSSQGEPCPPEGVCPAESTQQDWPVSGLTVLFIGVFRFGGLGVLGESPILFRGLGGGMLLLDFEFWFFGYNF